MTDLFSSSSELDELIAHLTSLVNAKTYTEVTNIAEEALARFPDSAELLRIYAVALHWLNRRIEALRLLHRAEKLSPGNLEVQCDLASLEITEGLAKEAIKRMRTALRSNPDNPKIPLILGNALMAAGRYQQARDSYATAAQSFPADPNLHVSLAAAELEIDRPEQSALHADEAIRLAPKMGSAHAMLGYSYRARGRYAEATQAFLKAEQLEPLQNMHAYHAGLMFDELRQPEHAQHAYARALQSSDTNGAALSQYVFTLRRLCQWDELEALSVRLRKAVADGIPGVMPFGFLAEEVSADEQLHCAKTFSAAIETKMDPVRQRLSFKHLTPSPKTAIRVGFVSDGFGMHPTGMLIVAMLEALKSSDLEIHLYSTAANDGSAIRKRLDMVGKMHQIHSLNNAAQAQRIYADKIEILIDLSVYCDGVNPRLFSLRPAPLQVNWFGYPGSSGAPWLDYMLADAVVQPDHLRSSVSEKLVRLPRCFQPNDTSREIASAPSREDCGLPTRGTVFACFNASYKINPQTFDLFTKILNQTPESVLWLLSGPENADVRLRKHAQMAGVAADRLIFMPSLGQADHLARYEHIDLFLDTLPHNARMPAYDALSTGCPVLTCSGETFASRITASMLHHVGLPELITEDKALFVALAVSLGSNHEALQLLRHHLAQQRKHGKLFNMVGYANDFRRALQAMVARRRIGRPAADIDIS